MRDVLPIIFTVFIVISCQAQSEIVLAPGAGLVMPDGLGEYIKVFQPSGWEIDLKNTGGGKMLFLPIGSSFKGDKPPIFGLVFFSVKTNDSDSVYMAANEYLILSKKYDLSATLNKISTIVVSGRTLTTFLCRMPAVPRYDNICYIDHGKSMVVIVVTANSLKLLDSSAPFIEEIGSKYLFIPMNK
jgi:hypothetical protein